MHFVYMFIFLSLEIINLKTHKKWSFSRISWYLNKIENIVIINSIYYMLHPIYDQCYAFLNRRRKRPDLTLENTHVVRRPSNEDPYPSPSQTSPSCLDSKCGIPSYSMRFPSTHRISLVPGHKSWIPSYSVRTINPHRICPHFWTASKEFPNI